MLCVCSFKLKFQNRERLFNENTARSDRLDTKTPTFDALLYLHEY